jgi:hypothetical protein
VRAALRAAASCGPFFELAIHDQGPPAGWQPAAELYRDGLPGTIAQAARQLGTSEHRVAASILHQGLAARLWSPVLGSGLLCGVVPDLSALVVDVGPPLRLGVTEISGRILTSASQLATLSADIVGRQLTALEAALPGPPPAGLLRGNSASAMVGALEVLSRARPDRAPAAIELARALLDTSYLTGAGTLAGADTDTGTGPVTFRRRSCCLYYRLPSGGLCGDCCFVHTPGDQRPQG